MYDRNGLRMLEIKMRSKRESKKEKEKKRKRKANRKRGGECHAPPEEIERDGKGEDVVFLVTRT